MEEPTTNTKKAVTVVIAVLVAMFALGVWFYELGTEQGARHKLERYGDMLAPEVESLDRPGADRSARLIVLLGDFAALDIVDADGRRFVQVKGDGPDGVLDRALSAIGLIRLQNLSQEVVVAGASVGRINAQWINRNIYAYLYLAAFLILLVKSGQYYGRQSRIQRDLERQVATQTAELSESNMLLRKQIAEREQTEQEMIKIERLGALGQMASGIAHDFNNLLSIILGYSELLLADTDELDDKETVENYLDIIKTSATDAAEVVRRLRGFYRFRATDEQFRPVELNPLVEQAVALTQPKWGEQALASGRTIKVSSDLGEVGHVNGNETELREVLTNLIFNAVDAMPESGSITVSTGSENGHAVLEVTDTGSGMTEEVRQRCLEPFFSTKGEHGTGLGLGLVHGIIRRHEGQIRLETEEGKGTSFFIRLPALADSEVVTVAAPVADSQVREPLHILVVDDEPSFCNLVSGFLTSDGHTVETAHDGREGLRKFLAGRFDVVLLDQAMPEMSGTQVAAAIKQMTPDKPVILVSGFADVMEAVGEEPAGVDLILSKPVTLERFREALVEATQN